MIFSRRTNHWSMGQNKLDHARGQLTADTEVFDLTQSNPTHAALNYPKTLLLAFNDPKILAYEPHAFGIEQTRQAIAQYYKEVGYGIDVRNMVLTASTSEGYGFLMRLLTNPYEKVLIPRPSYPLFSYLLDIHDVAYDYYSLNGDGSIDREGLLKILDPTVKAIMVVAPNNPTGYGISTVDKKWLLATILKNNIALIVDEVFADYTWGNKPFERFVDGSEGLVFVLNGLSKILALPQMKLGWIYACGNPDLVRASIERLDIIADTYLSVNTPVQWAAISWLKDRSFIQSGIQERIQNNLDFLDVHLPSTIKRRSAQGGWYAVLQLQTSMNDEEIAIRFLQEGHVLVFPGYFFDMNHEHTIVISLLTVPSVFQEGIKRLCQISI